MVLGFFISRPCIPTVLKIPKIQKIIVTIQENTSELAYLEQLYQALEIRDANPYKKVIFKSGV